MIPENVIIKPPTAELRENQKDQDSLPPYDVLDQILERLVEREEPIATIVAAGFERDTVLQGRPPARSRRIQAAAGRARRQGDAAEFRPRPPLSDRQSLPRHRRAVAGAGSHIAQARRFEQNRSVRFLKDVLSLSAVARQMNSSVRPRGTVRFGSGLDGPSSAGAALAVGGGRCRRSSRRRAGAARPGRRLRIGLRAERPAPA